MAVPSAALVEWLRASGGAAHPALDFFAAAAAADGDRRVVARQPIDCGDLLLRLPPCCVLPLLGLGDHRKSSCVKILGALRPPPSAMVQAALELLCVRNQATAGCDGHWQPYINSLPRTCVTPAMYWSDTQRELLAGTMIADDVLQRLREQQLIGSPCAGCPRRKRRKESRRPHSAENPQSSAEFADGPSYSPASLSACWEQIVQPLSKVHPDIFPAAQCTFECFRWALFCVITRGFTEAGVGSGPTAIGTASRRGDGQWFALPLADMLQHCPPPMKATSLHYDGDRADGSHGGFTMLAERRIEAGDEVAHCYDEHLTDARLAANYGFALCPIASHCATVDLPLRLLEAAARKELGHVESDEAWGGSALVFHAQWLTEEGDLDVSCSWAATSSAKLKQQEVLGMLWNMAVRTHADEPQPGVPPVNFDLVAREGDFLDCISEVCRCWPVVGSIFARALSDRDRVYLPWRQLSADELLLNRRLSIEAATALKVRVGERKILHALRRHMLSLSQPS